MQIVVSLHSRKVEGFTATDVWAKKAQKFISTEQNTNILNYTIMAIATFTSKEIILTEHEILMIKNHGGLCLASAKSVLERSKLDFDDIERLNNVFKKYRWGSDADRKYRKQAINKAINLFASNTLNYITL